MYLEYFGFSEPPFELTPDPKFLFLTPPYREAISNVQYGIEARKALTVLVGEAGTGKTTVLRKAVRGLERYGGVLCQVSNPTLTRAEFLELLVAGFGLAAPDPTSKASVLLTLESRLRQWQAEGKPVALIVDEAQSLSDELLEEIRLLANMETDERKLLPLVLAGQPELGERLNQPQLRQIKQRVALRCELRAFDLHETAAYIAGRIRAAGGDSARVFTREAVTAIHGYSRGIPRVISVLCDNALVSGMAVDRRPISRDLVAEIAQDFDLAPRGHRVGAGAVTLLPEAPVTAAALDIHAAEAAAVPAVAVAAGQSRRRFRFF